MLGVTVGRDQRCSYYAGLVDASDGVGSSAPTTKDRDIDPERFRNLLKLLIGTHHGNVICLGLRLIPVTFKRPVNNRFHDHPSLLV